LGLLVASLSHGENLLAAMVNFVLFQRSTMTNDKTLSGKVAGSFLEKAMSYLRRKFSKGTNVNLKGFMCPCWSPSGWNDLALVGALVSEAVRRCSVCLIFATQICPSKRETFR
jgi:hypothetical protein